MRALFAQLMVLFTGAAGHLATLAMVVVGLVLAALVVLFTVRGRHICPTRKLASDAGTAACPSTTGCCRR